jgi:hypothetical protein
MVSSCHLAVLSGGKVLQAGMTILLATISCCYLGVLNGDKVSEVKITTTSHDQLLLLPGCAEWWQGDPGRYGYYYPWSAVATQLN